MKNESNSNYKEKIFLLALISFLALFACSEKKSAHLVSANVIQNDSISDWLNKFQQQNLTESQQLKVLSAAVEQASDIKNDTLKAQYFALLSNNYPVKADSAGFRYTNKKSLDLNLKVNDSLAIAESYWNLAAFYDYYSVKDSAYFAYSEAQKIYDASNKSLLAGKMLLQMAKLQAAVKDYVGSETTVTKAIERFKPLNDNKNLFDSYNILGIAMGALGETDKSLAYYNEALYYLKQEPLEKYQEARIINNIGIVYLNTQQYEKATRNFEQILDIENFKIDRPDLFGIAVSNLATSKLYNKDTLGINSLFLTAIDLKEKENKINSLAGTYYNYSEYKAFTNDTLKALSLAYKSEELSNKTDNFEILLKAWVLLANLKKENAQNYFEKYIKLNDSLQKEERRQQNKFARIRFETDEFIAQNVELESEKEILSKQKQMWAGIAATFFLLGLSIYIIIHQRAKNQKLRFDQQQQANNQEIFNLMLMQKQKVDEVKRMEQKRISEELHDGILGKMLGARMVLTGLNKRATEEAIQEKSKALSSLQDIEHEIRSISHELSHTAYQKINNFTDSVASLLASSSKNTAIDAAFNYNEDEDWDALAGDVKINVYRIIQETFQNAIKHSNCSQFTITFNRDDNNFYVAMNDNGSGFNPNKGKRGIGIRNISSRMKKLGGIWDIDSNEGVGTTIKLEIPLKKNSPKFINTNSQFENV